MTRACPFYYTHVTFYYTCDWHGMFENSRDFSRKFLQEVREKSGGYQEGLRLRLGQEVIEEAVVDVHHVVEQQHLAFRVWELESRVSGFGFRVSGFGRRVYGSGFRVQFRVQGSGFRVWGLGFGVWGLGCGIHVQGFGFTLTP